MTILHRLRHRHEPFWFNPFGGRRRCARCLGVEDQVRRMQAFAASPPGTPYPSDAALDMVDTLQREGVR